MAHAAAPPAGCRSLFFTPTALPLRPVQLTLSSLSSLSCSRRSKRSPIKCSVSDLQLSSHNPKDTQRKSPANAVYLLLLANLGVFTLDHWLQVDGVKQLYLYHRSPRWYQFVTSTVCHGSWSHLSSNLFFVYIFGKLVEEEEGGLAMWLCYIITGAGANLLSWLLLPPNVVSCGASGAVFGLFAISVLVKLSWDWRKLLEVLILGQFVLEKVITATSMVHQQNSNVNHVAHCAGALIGVLLIWLITRIPRTKENS